MIKGSVSGSGFGTPKRQKLTDPSPDPWETQHAIGIICCADLYGDEDSVFTDDSYGDGQSTYRNNEPAQQYGGNDSPRRWERSFLQSTPER
jgi:hypothetical protein